MEDSGAVDLDALRALAEQHNLAQQRMGTKLVSIDETAATIVVDPRDELLDGDGCVSSGVIAAMLDHACGLAAVARLSTTHQVGGTISLRVDHCGPRNARTAAHATARVVAHDGSVVTAHAVVFHDDPAEPLAVGTCSMVVRPREP